VDNGKDQRDMEIWFRTIPKPWVKRDL
jgi:hypothetical protein